jgi:glucose/arabinose dehydrogenase
MKRLLPLLISLLLATAHAAEADLPLHNLRLPAGFSIDVFARVLNARQMALGTRTLFVGSMRAGRVTALPLDEHWRPGPAKLVAHGLSLPVGVAFRDGALYVSAVDRILRFDDIENQLDNPPSPIEVGARLPGERHHGWKFIAFGPDGWLYIPVGAPCNICRPHPDRYAVILRQSPDGSDREIVARGVRNSVGFDWQPGSGALWFTDNGRDLLGDDLPPDELNRVSRPGEHFGYPDCHGGDLADPDLDQPAPCAGFTPPIQQLGAHVASLGMRFYTGAQFPGEYRGNVFIAEHGSWNRSKKAGYRITRVVIANDKATRYEAFVDGWLQGESAWGRPADVLVLPDGSLLISDDHAGAIYRVSYREGIQR